MKQRVLALSLLASLTSLATGVAHADKLDDIQKLAWCVLRYSIATHRLVMSIRRAKTGGL